MYIFDQNFGEAGVDMPLPPIPYRSLNLLINNKAY